MRSDIEPIVPRRAAAPRGFALVLAIARLIGLAAGLWNASWLGLMWIAAAFSYTAREHPLTPEMAVFLVPLVGSVIAIYWPFFGGLVLSVGGAAVWMTVRDEPTVWVQSAPAAVIAGVLLMVASFMSRAKSETAVQARPAGTLRT